MRSTTFALVLAAVCSLVYGQTPNKGELSSILLEVFGPGPTIMTTITTLPPFKTIPTQPPPAEVEVCLTEGKEEGECVPYYLCNNNKIITDGVGLIDIRVRDGPCNSYLDACCLPVNRVEQPITPAPVLLPEPTPGEVAQYASCGHRNPDGVGFRITGDSDNEARFAEFPWMVAVLKESPLDSAEGAVKLNVYVCGGSLINPSVTLTAAHCVMGNIQNKNVLVVRAGEWDTQTKKEIYAHQDRRVDSVEVHKEYYAGALFYDAALLFLVSPVDLAENIGTVCLPPPRITPTPGARCYASGWGKDKFGKEGQYQVFLKKIELPVVGKPECQEALRKTRLGRNFNLHQSFMCAGGEPGKDTCRGDGGSPLVCPIEGEERYEQTGIVAWGIGCGETGTPGVYVDVSMVRDWIDEHMTAKNMDKNTYISSDTVDTVPSN